MKMCSICKKNPAVVFVSKIEGANRVNEGYCLSCALKLGVMTKEQLAEQVDLPPEMFENMLEGLENGDSEGVMNSIQDFLAGSNLMEMMPDDFNGSKIIQTRKFRLTIKEQSKTSKMKGARKNALTISV